ncbi:MULTISPECIES: carboxypeptidase M32 [unclassified Serratia (in: enterobacteria)]|uniref:carboxypeptidase M32 n=1 Tax=unclassified Serratia (in: enterobacteria) TaxID=2647522 RepID=UPI0005027BC9|nr:MULTISPECIES: carboxypeptidase M32 [unclassified Serratia (in: enterobacteria)]KFK96881.1 carboxypeptidase [Serratia sp. Ag2]KFK97424.1 carboxypeptidase [Serratia sp. Ag1]
MTATPLKAQIARLSDLLNVINLLNWDASTGMPNGASIQRGQQIATLSSLAQSMILSPELASALADEAALPNLTLHQQRSHQALRQAIAHYKKVPASLVVEQAQLVAVAEVAWREAREQNNFSLFQPYLEKIVDLKRRFAEVVGYQNHPYEALTHEYEPGLTVPALKTLFAQLQARLLPLVKRVHAAPKPDNSFLHRHFPVDQQRALSTKLAGKIGYDFQRGRLDTTTHPFEISITREDVRITTRFNPQFLNAGLFGTLHEAGHAIYEQNVAPELSGTALTLDLFGLYAVAGTSYGVHESQSRLWENRVGRSLPFWHHHYAELQATFPGVLDDVSVEQFHRAINRSEPSLIRVEADELTYDFHVMLRVEIEMGLIEGSLKVSDLPAFWAEKIQAYLGVKPTTDTLGVLQDIHWSKGMIGSFPTYTLGNVMGSQFMAAALQQQPSLATALVQGNYLPLKSWLTENILQHGRTYLPHELLQRATGKGLDATPYLDYLEQKFTALYQL